MLNGNRYDALTGELIKDDSGNQKVASTARAHKSTPASSMVDDFVKPRRTSQPAKNSQRPVEHSKTLMRSAVKKPKPQKNSPDTTPHIQKSAVLKNVVREERAKEISRSSLISKFGGEVKRITKFSQLPVTPEPSTHAEREKPTPTSETHRATPPAPTRFQTALANATSHQQPKKSRKHRNHRLAKKLHVSPMALNVSLLVVAFTLLGGYFAYNNVPNLAMRVAATRAGIAGDLPDYQPAGFSMKGPIQYQPGQIAVQFASHSDDRNFTMSQKKSEWNSETLLENYVATNRRAYQTFQDKGKTIYIYDGDSASWVDNGVWYEIDGNEALNTDQLLRIANSL